LRTTISGKARGFVRRVLPEQDASSGVTQLDLRQADRLRAQAASLRARAEKLVAEAQDLRKEADAFDRAANVLEAAAGRFSSARIKRSPLSDGGSNRSIGGMDVDTTGRAVAVKMGAGRAKRKHPAQRRLYEQGHTITSIAAELREGRPRVNAWFAVGDANRPIPRRHAEYLRDRYGIPISDWSRIAD
jgi:hypothetical protein